MREIAVMQDNMCCYEISLSSDKGDRSQLDQGNGKLKCTNAKIKALEQGGSGNGKSIMIRLLVVGCWITSSVSFDSRFVRF